MKETMKLTFKEKHKLLKGVFDEYQKAKVKLHCLEMSNFYPEIHYDVVKEKSHHYTPTNIASILNTKINDKEELTKIIETFDYIISILSEDSKRIVENEFVKNKKYDWWREYYAKSTYYRLKAKAMEEVLFYLNS